MAASGFWKRVDCLRRLDIEPSGLMKLEYAVCKFDVELDSQVGTSTGTLIQSKSCLGTAPGFL